jgi:hypothetical protein
MCTITLIEFRGVDVGGSPFNGPGVPPFIRVSGSIVGCPPPRQGWLPTVSISMSCSGVVHGLSVNGTNQFSHDFENQEHCPCDADRSVTITCDNDPACTQTFNAVGLQCGKSEPPACPPGSPLGAAIVINEALTCNPAGERDVTATVALNPGWNVGRIVWSWDGTAAVPSSPATASTSPSRSLAGGATHSITATATLLPPYEHCSHSVSRTFQVTACPGGPPPPTPSPTPTPAPTPAPTPNPTPGPTPNPTPGPTPGPTPRPTPGPTSAPTPGPALSPACGFLLILALALLGLAAVGLAVGGGLGPIGVALSLSAAALGAAGLVMLGLWMALCRDCRLMRFLQRFFGGMAILMLLVAALLLLFGLVLPAAGAVAVAGLFGLIVGVLSVGIAILGCP